MSDLQFVSPMPRYLMDRHEAWRGRDYQRDHAWYKRLATGGQHPRAMLISCCDSRADTVRMFGAEPGDLFVVRNVANIVPPYHPDHGHHGTSAAVEFAVTGLKVAHIVIVGHSDCGGVKACVEMCSSGKKGDDDSFVGRWMEILRPGYERVAKTAKKGDDMYTALEREGVLTSLRNLQGFPFVAEACKSGMLTLHGARILIGSGELELYDPETGEWRIDPEE